MITEKAFTSTPVSTKPEYPSTDFLSLLYVADKVIFVKYKSDNMILLVTLSQWLPIAPHVNTTEYEKVLQNLIPTYLPNLISHWAPIILYFRHSGLSLVSLHPMFLPATGTLHVIFLCKSFFDPSSADFTSQIKHLFLSRLFLTPVHMHTYIHTHTDSISISQITLM